MKLPDRFEWELRELEKRLVVSGQQAGVPRLRSLRLAIDQTWRALEASVKLQTHYAELLNMHDDGERIGFKDAEAWIARLKEIGDL